MRTFTTRFDFLTVAFLSIFAACNQADNTASEQDSDSDTAVIARTPGTVVTPTYDSAMDPLVVGAKFSKKLGDTLNIKLYESTLKPGDSAPMHKHPDHVYYVVNGGRMALYLEGKERMVMDFKTGMGAVNGPVSDAAKNIGKSTIKMLLVDIYRPALSAASAAEATEFQKRESAAVGANLVKTLGDSLGIHMYEITAKPGDSLSIHKHPDHIFYVLQGGKLAVNIEGQERQVWDIKPGMGAVSAALSDAVKNVGNSTIRFLVVDVHRPR